MKSPHVLISASAGSGKTYRLVHHFLGIIHDALLAPGRDRQPDVVDRILAATFTRAAAGEITERILKRLAEAMLKPDVRGELSNELACGDLSAEQVGVMLFAVVTKLHRLRVGTLDSFLIRSAQAFATELGLPADWTILNDAQDKAVALGAIDRLLTDAADDAEQFSMMVDLLIGLHGDRLPLQVRHRLMKHLRETQPALIAGPPQAWEVIAPRREDLLDSPELIQRANELCRLAEPHIPRTQKGTLYTGWVSAIGAVAQIVRDEDWTAIFKAGINQNLATASPE